MNLDHIDDVLRREIFEGIEGIGFFVHQGRYYWVIDWEAHFNLDQEKNFRASLARGTIKGNSEFKEAKKSFRGGIPTLTSKLFPKYLKSSSAKVVTTDLLHSEFFLDDHGQYAKLSTLMEHRLSFDKLLDGDARNVYMKLHSKLPKFYVNFDRKLFMHMVHSRAYETVVLDGWWGAQCDFEHMIPISHRYWVRGRNEDFWAATSV